MKTQTEYFQWLQSIYLTPDPGALPTEACPDLDELRAAAVGQLPPRQRRDILDHATGCAYCLESWQIALKLRDCSEIPRPSGRQPTHQPRTVFFEA